MEPTIKLLIQFELPYKTVEQFDAWRDAEDDAAERDTCVTCPVRQLCDITMVYDECVDENGGCGDQLLGCSGIYSMALKLRDK